MSKETLGTREDAPVVPPHLIDDLKDYILYGFIETMPVSGFEHLPEAAWGDFTRDYIEYSQSVGRGMSHDERVTMFAEASRLAYEVHQQDRKPNTPEKLEIPLHFYNPKIVSEEGWSYIQDYFQERHIGHQPSTG